VAAAFFRTGMIEAWGRGIEKMLAACRDAGVPEPTFSTEGSGLWTTFRFTTRGTAAAQQPASGPGAGQVTPQVTPQVETLLVLLAEQALSGTQIRAGLRLKDRMHLQKAYVAPAIEAGLVEMTIPDRPSSRLQKYRLTAQGKAALAAARKA
jgi:ATP-dependent DNA helicase RecG